MATTNYPFGVSSFGVPVLGGASIPFTGTYYFCDPANGGNGNDGLSPATAVKTLYAAHDRMTAGKNDVCYLIGNGATTGTARLSLALAVGTTPAATVGTFVWSKAACHLIGVASPTSINQRARIAPPATGTRAAIFNSGNFVSVTAEGCYFSNFSVFNGFATGGVDQIAWTDSGGRNCYNNVSFLGKTDAASAGDTGSSSLLVTGSTGENTFINCQIGSDTIQAVDASYQLSFAAASPRNRFENCIISIQSGGANSGWISAGSGAINHYAIFRNCLLTNNGTAMTLGALVNAAAGGVFLFQNSMFYGAATMSTGALCFSNIAAGAAKGGLAVVSS